jgi:hypothetical protein
MEVTNCTDINGVALNELQFNVDGTVVGLIDVNGTQTPSNLSYDCCTAQGYTFDPNDTKCYWAAACLSGGTYNIVLDPQGNSGALFQVNEYEEDVCHLEVNFKFLLRFDCENMTDSLRNILETLKLTVTVEKVILDETLPIPNNLEEVATQDLFNVTNIFEFLNENENTGILLNGNCTSVTNTFISDLTPNAGVLNDLSLNSDWYNFTMVIDDPVILETIFNERLKLSIKGNILDNFAILLDDVQMNRVCNVPTPPEFLDEECPNFELKRIIDNKKSWVRNEEFELREFDLNRRETAYEINSERLSINTKEIDLGVNSSQAIDNDVVQFITDNTCLLEPATGCTSGSTTHECIDLTPLITTEILSNDDLISQLIDVKNRKTLSAYPTLELIYHRYLNSLEHCGVSSNGLNTESINDFIGLLGTYWTDLIEQVVPATTIWGSSTVNSDFGFGAKANKFVYRKSTTFTCGNIINNTYPSPAIGDENNMSVQTEDITDGSYFSTNFGRVSNCVGVSIRQLNCGSEFIGTVSVIGDGEPPLTGDTISITETITDECDLYEDCEVS